MAATASEPQDFVILVDEHDRETGTAEKMDAHLRGVLHRAFSVMVWDSQRRLLLQKRAACKYHSGSLWTNTTCGHPRPGETLDAAAVRRLQEEMGFACPLSNIGHMIYRAEVGSGLTEYELVHVYVGLYDGAIRPDPAECDGYAWLPAAEFKAGVAQSPDCFSAWFQKYVAAQWPVAAPA